MSEPVELVVGTNTWTVSVPADKRVPLSGGDVPTPAATPAELLRTAVQNLIALNGPLQQAIAPDDRVTVVVDETLPHLVELVSELLAQLVVGGVTPASVTLLVQPPSGTQPWADELPDEFGDVHLEVHDPNTPAELAYLGTTQAGRRIYLNRHLVDADLVVVLSGRRFDPAAEYAGAEVSLFPALSNAETRDELAKKADTDDGPAAIREEAATVTWHLGLPVFVQVIEGPGDTIAEVVAGLPKATDEGIKRQDARWLRTAGGPADLVIATVGGSGERVTFRDLADAVGVVRDLVTADGRLVLLTAGAPELDVAAAVLREAESPAEATKRLANSDLGDWASALQWGLAAKRANLFVSSGWPAETAEELFATAVSSASELQRLIDAADRVLIVPDANKTAVELS